MVVVDLLWPKRFDRPRGRKRGPIRVAVRITAPVPDVDRTRRAVGQTKRRPSCAPCTATPTTTSVSLRTARVMCRLDIVSVARALAVGIHLMLCPNTITYLSSVSSSHPPLASLPCLTRQRVRRILSFCVSYTSAAAHARACYPAGAASGTCRHGDSSCRWVAVNSAAS